MAREGRKASRSGAREVVRLRTSSMRAPSRRIIPKPPPLAVVVYFEKREFSLMRAAMGYDMLAAWQTVLKGKRTFLDFPQYPYFPCVLWWITVDHRKSILVVAQPGLLRTSLVAVLTSAPEINVIAEADDLSLALSILEQQHPDLILVADNLNDQDWLALRQIKLQFPQTRRVVLVDDVKQKQALESPGAEAVLLKGAPASNLFTALECVSADLRD